MNIWDCEYPGCKNSCIGIKYAIGLRAIGWYFVPFGMSPSGRIELFCPIHHPDGYDKAREETKDIQDFIFDKFNIKNPD